MAQTPTEASREVLSSSDMIITANWEDEETVVFQANTDSRDDLLEFRDFRSVELLFGLWMDCGPFQIEADDPNRIPRRVAVAGQKQIAAYLAFVEPGDSGVDKYIRESIAQAMGVNKQTVSNYWSRMRWDGCPTCLSEDTDNIVVDVGRDEVKLRVCNHCGEYFVNREDIVQKPHTGEKHPECVDELEPVVGYGNGDEYKLNACLHCGYYTSDSSGSSDEGGSKIPIDQLGVTSSADTSTSNISDLDVSISDYDRTIPVTTKVRHLVEQLEDTTDHGVPTETVVTVATDSLDLDEEDVQEAIEINKQRGVIYETTADHLQAT